MNAPSSSQDAILLESGTNEVEFIEFYLGGISYGINVSKVQRVIARSNVSISKVAQAPFCAEGIIHILDKPIMLLDLKKALNIASDCQAEATDRQLVLVTAFNKQTTAFMIDGISKIHRTSWANFEPIGDGVGDENDSGFSTGTVTLDDNIIVILDLERLMLSLFPESHSNPINHEVPSKKAGREDVRILYAEDSKMVRHITEDILAKAGYSQILSFENGHDAHQHLLLQSGQGDSQSACPYDLVLTDIEMPRMDGLTLCRKLKTELYPANPPKVIVYSSLINKEMAAKCRSVGADAQLAKPDVEQIVDLLDELCLAK